MTVEADLLRTHALGLRCTGIFRDKTREKWVVNLRHWCGRYTYGLGNSPSEAMAAAVENLKKEQKVDDMPVLPKAPEAKPDIEDMF